MALPDSVFDDSDLKNTTLPDSVFDDSDLKTINASNRLGGIGPYGLNLESSKDPQAFLAGIPKGFGELGANANKEITSLLNSLPSGTSSNLLSSLSGGLSDIGSNILNKKVPDNFISPPNPFEYSNNQDFLSRYLNKLEQSSPGSSNAGQFLGNMLALGPMSSTVSTIPGAIGTGAAQGALTNPNNPLVGASVGSVLGGIGGGVQKGLNWTGNTINDALNNSVNEAFQRLGIENAGLGERMQSPNLASFSQNVLPKTPFSGMAQNYQNINDQLNKSVSDAMNSIKPSVPIGQIPQDIQGYIKQTYKDVVNAKNEDFKNLDKNASDAGISVSQDEKLNTINNYLKNNQQRLFNAPQLALQPSVVKALQTYKDAAGGGFNTGKDVVDYMNALMPDEDFENTKDVISHLNDNYDANLKNTKDLLGYANKTRPNTFGDASLSAGIFNDNAYNAFKNDDPTSGKVWLDLKNATLRDMDNSGINNPEIKDEYNNIIGAYKDQYVPFLDPQIRKYLQPGSLADNPDLLISTFLKTGQNNQPTLLNKLMSKIPEDKKQDVGYYFLNKSLPRDDLGNPIMNRNTLVNLNKSLQNYDPQVRNQLIPQHVQQVLNDVETAQSSIINPMANPPTGQRIADLLGIGSLASLGFAAYKDPEHRNDYLAGIGAVAPGGRLAKIALTSPAIRNALQNVGNSAASKFSPLVASIVNNLMNSHSNNYQNGNNNQ